MNALYENGFNPDNLKLAREAIDQALNNLNLGFKLKLGKINYTSDSFTCKLEASVPAHEARKDAEELMYLATMAGFHDIDHTKEPSINGRGVCKLVSYNNRAPKNPWIVLHGDGKRYKYSTKLVKLYWSAPK